MHRSFGFELSHDEYGTARSEPLLRDFCITAVGHFIDQPEHREDRMPKFKAEFSLHYCVSGNGRVDVDGTWVDIKPGMVFVCMPDARHRYRANPKDPWSLYFLHAAGPGIYDYLRWLGFSAKNRILHVGLDAVLIAKFEEAFHAFARGRTTRAFIYGSQVVRGILGYLGARAPVEHGLGMEMHEIGRLMKENLGKRMNLKKLAEAADLSVFYFCREFKKNMGVPPRQYLNRLIAEEGGHLLLSQPEGSVRDVAAKVGITNTAYFSRLFRQHMGVSPLQYRRNHLSFTYERWNHLPRKPVTRKSNRARNPRKTPSEP